jgi:neurofibromin 1
MSELMGIFSDCANAWRARWMGLVAGTCFQHNPATQPQAFIVLGYLASDEVDDDLLYQVLVAMGSVLNQFSETDNILATSILRCLSRVTPGLLPDSRYAGSLFWVGFGVCQLGYIPLFAPALELILVALRAVEGELLEGGESLARYLQAVRAETEAGYKLDKVGAVNFDTDVGYSLVAILFKGVRHPSTRGLTLEVLQELLRLSVLAGRGMRVGDGVKMVGKESVAFFVALLPVILGSGGDVGDLFEKVGLAREVQKGELGVGVYELLDVP